MLKRTFLKMGAALAVTASLATGATAAELNGPVNYIIPFGPGENPTFPRASSNRSSRTSSARTW